MVHQVENFFGCYLLYCKNPKFKGRTYIGFTVNPKRRIAQHNAGKQKGGAWRTSGRGPWDMTLIVHGFPSDIAALRFEWAWQHPESSRRLRHIPGKNRKETAYQYRIRILSNMLCERPWSILPLTVRWLKQEYCTELLPSPPPQMSFAYGPVEVRQPKQDCKKDLIQTEDYVARKESDIPLLDRIDQKLLELETGERKSANGELCNLCSTVIKCNLLKCNMDCGAVFHMVCLAEILLQQGNASDIIPVEGNCPNCGELLLWGELIRKSQGFHQYLGDCEAEDLS